MKKCCPILLTTLSLLLVGCRGIQSEMQKSSMRAASPAGELGNKQMRLTAKLFQLSHAVEDGFDLGGTVTISAVSGNVPDGFAVNQLSLKPSWKGFPGYYVVNFNYRNGNWQRLGAYGSDPSFSATTQRTNGQINIEFLWLKQGRGLTKKPEHFVAYDVSVCVTDSSGTSLLLSQKGVPTK